MSSRTLSAKGAARRFPLYSFLARECPSSLPQQPGVAPSPFSSPSNPFAPTKASPLARSWTAPKYSLRRQKKLRLEAANLGYPQDVLPPPFTKLNAQLKPKPAQRLAPERRALAPSQHVPASKVLGELGLEKYGPYAGRKGAPFKGKIWERKKEERTQELAKLLAGADQKIAAWKKVRTFFPFHFFLHFAHYSPFICSFPSPFNPSHTTSGPGRRQDQGQGLTAVLRRMQHPFLPFFSFVLSKRAAHCPSPLVRGRRSVMSLYSCQRRVANDGKQLIGFRPLLFRLVPPLLLTCSLLSSSISVQLARRSSRLIIALSRSPYEQSTAPLSTRGHWQTVRSLPPQLVGGQ